MKKIICVLLCFILMFSVFGCTYKEDNKTDNYLPTYVIVVIGVHDVRHIGKMHIS